MSRLSEMIKELCPDGVEYKKLKEIFDTKNGYTPSKSNESYWENGTIPWFRMEDIRENGHILSDSIQHVNLNAIKGALFPANSIIVATSATVGEHALITVPSLANQRFTYLMLKHEYASVFDIKFLFYYCYKLDLWCLSHLNQGSFPSVDMKQFSRFEIPIPPLAIQNEIVKLLDNFTELTAELTAELALRKKQYSFYRDSLLNFSQDNTEVEWKTLGEIATDIFRGAGIRRDEVTEDGIPCVRYGEIYTKYGIWFDSCFSHTNEAVHSVPKYFEHGDILFAITGENIDEIAKSTAYIGNEKCLAGGDIVVLKHEQNPKYLSYVLSTEMAQKQKSRGKVKSKVVHSSVPAIKDIKIPIPPLETQAKIVSIFDRFDELCHDLTQGLPAEIAARKKQYEYYRDKLLTFRQKGA